MILDARALLVFILVIWLVTKFILYTFMIHRHNILLRKQLGAAAYGQLTKSSSIKKVKSFPITRYIRLTRLYVFKISKIKRSSPKQVFNLIYNRGEL